MAEDCRANLHREGYRSLDREPINGHDLVVIALDRGRRLEDCVMSMRR